MNDDLFERLKHYVNGLVNSEEFLSKLRSNNEVHASERIKVFPTWDAAKAYGDKHTNKERTNQNLLDTFAREVATGYALTRSFYIDDKTTREIEVLMSDLSWKAVPNCNNLSGTQVEMYVQKLPL